MLVSGTGTAAGHRVRYRTRMQQDAIDDAGLKRHLARELSALAESGATSSPKALLERVPTDWPGIDVATVPRAPVAAHEIYRAARRSVVAVAKLYTCSRCDKHHANVASGFVIAASGLIVTSRHVVDDAEREAIGIMTFDGAVYPVKSVVCASRRDDLAVLQVPADDLVPLPLGPEPPVGSTIHVLGHPAGQLYTFTTGIVSRFASHAFRVPDDAADGDEPPTESRSRFRLMTITAGFGRGAGGAPVLDTCGAVVGVARQTKSIHHHADDDTPPRLQMVLKQCASSAALVELGLRPAGVGRKFNATF